MATHRDGTARQPFAVLAADASESARGIDPSGHDARRLRRQHSESSAYPLATTAAAARNEVTPENLMSEKTGVDVLQTIDKALARVRLIGWPHAMNLEDARSAIAELMEAAQDVNEWLIRSGLGATAHQQHLADKLNACRSPAKDK